ncbi:diguanylate cyclase domain-containing protein [Streptacidiphilus sp. N1-12]|uniref:Diguanylate cyclase domain-containing protein n=2 Tax=Streptacidiphilus alkalitolerans TaxID=3342712 RepID=A0ABV6X4V5_9ACTN
MSGTGGADARLRAVVGLAQAMSAAQTRIEAVQVAARRAREALDADMGAVSVWERDTGRLRVLVNNGLLAAGEEELPEDESYALAEYPEIARFLAQKGLGEPWTVDGLPRAWAQSVDDSPDGPACRERAASLRRRGRGCCLVAPILLRGRAWGELYLARKAGAPVFSDEDAGFATVLAAQISAGLAQSEELEEVRRLAFTDALTGLANRRAIDAKLDTALEAHRADGTVVSLVVCDVNGLKRVNDEKGHEVGDQLLAHFADQLSLCGAMLPGSVVGRLGGDEFCLVAEGVSADEVVRVAEELCAQALTLDQGEGVACGVASTGDPIGPVTTADRLFRLADAAQYRAKAGQAAHPVVAGRGQAPDPTVRLAEGAADPRSDVGGRKNERRRFRGARHSAEPGLLLSAVIGALDDEQPTRRVHPGDTLGRLEVVAETSARLLDAVSWWISYVPPGTAQMRTAHYGVRRMTRGPGSIRAQVQRAINEAPDAVFDLRAYPLTAQAVRGGAFSMRVGVPGNDPAEEAVLLVGGYRAVLAAGGHNPAGGWLIELFADDSTLSFAALGPVLRALIAVALSGPASPPG